jgi:hypothetical protein
VLSNTFPVCSSPIMTGQVVKSDVLCSTHNVLVSCEELLAPCPIPKLQDHPCQLLIQYIHSYPPFLETF